VVVRWLAALAALTLLRLLVAASAPLSPDEAYYWVWSRALAPGYLDHPPMVALWIAAGTSLVGDTALGVRLLAPLATALGSVLLWDAAERLLPGRAAGPIAAALLNATLLLGVGAVTMTPDTPLLLFWTMTVWALARFAASGRGVWLIGAGLATGLAFASKYTAVFLVPGIVLWLLAVPGLRRWMWRPEPWIGAALGLLVALPIVVWNARHGWASFVKQGGRSAAWEPGGAVRFLAELAGSQVGFATPLIFVLCVAGVGVAIRRAWRVRDPGATLIAALTLPAVLVFIEHAFGDRVQGNWPAILYPTAAIGAAGLGEQWAGLRRPAIALGAVITLAMYIQATLAPVPLSPHLDPTMLRLAGWTGLAQEVDRARREAGASFVAADEYGIAAELARNLPGVMVVGVAPRWRFFDLPRAELAGRTGLLVRSLRRGPDIDRAPWERIDEVGRAARTRDGVTAEAFRLFRVEGRATSVPEVVVLPHTGQPHG
jgi:4-amino-4-deoxy-L-arabinose transferase-like glycosyltransferase